MEKIYFDEKTYIWKDVFDISHIKEDVLKECDHIISSMINNKTDNYRFFGQRSKHMNIDENFEIKSKIDEILNAGINACKSLFNDNIGKPYDKLYIDGWINIIRVKNPKQRNFSMGNEILMHTHTELNKKINSFIPTYTYVHYIQMPDNLEGKDGVLYLEGENGVIYDILPKENDLIIMESALPHVPASAKKSSKDRIVIAGNVGFEYTKKIKTLM